MSLEKIYFEKSVMHEVEIECDGFASYKEAKGAAFLKLYNEGMRDFSNYKLTLMNVSDVCIEGVVFCCATLSSVGLRNVKFKNCVFAGTTWQSVCLIKCNFSDCNFSNCEFEGCQFGDCDVSESLQFDESILKNSTSLSKMLEMNKLAPEMPADFFFEANSDFKETSFLDSVFKTCLFLGSSFVRCNFTDSLFLQYPGLSDLENENIKLRAQRIINQEG